MLFQACMTFFLLEHKSMLGRMFKLCKFVFFFTNHAIKVNGIVVWNNMTDDRCNK